MNSPKYNRAMVFISVIVICGAIPSVYQNFKTNPATQRPVSQQPQKLLSDAEFGVAAPSQSSRDLLDQIADSGVAPAKNANGTPFGAWAATLVVVPTEDNLYRDPATRKLYRVQNGLIVEDTNPYDGLTLEQNLLLAKINSDAPNPERQSVIYLQTPPSYMDNFYQQQTFQQNQQVIEQNRQALGQNQQALDDLRKIQQDAERRQQQQELQDILNRKIAP